MKRSFAKLLLLALVLLGCEVKGQTAPHRRGEHRHSDSAAYIASLENPARDAYQKPQQVIEALALKDGEIIADVGAGSGYFTLHLARAVGPKGHVYAVDVSPEMIVHLNRRVRDARLLNISSILAPPDDPLLPQPVDRFFFVNVWHHIDDQTGYLALMKKLLKPRGQVVMIDFHKRDLPVGPPVAEKIARNDLIAQLQQNGFRLVEEHTLLPYQYFLVFVAKQAFVSVPGSGLRVVEPPTELTRNAEPGTRNH